MVTDPRVSSGASKVFVLVRCYVRSEPVSALCTEVEPSSAKRRIRDVRDSGATSAAKTGVLLDKRTPREGLLRDMHRVGGKQRRILPEEP